MKFRALELIVKDLPAFNLNDVRKIDPAFHRQQLHDWQARGYIQPFAGGYYVLADADMNERVLFMLANKIYDPSYISLESALAYYKVIPETVLGVTSISSRKTMQYETGWGTFRYRRIKPPLVGYQVIETSPNTKFKMAFPEKAVLDYLYLNSDIQSIADFEGLRWNKLQLKELMDEVIFERYTKILGKSTLVNRVNLFKEYLNA